LQPLSPAACLPAYLQLVMGLAAGDPGGSWALHHHIAGRPVQVARPPAALPGSLCDPVVHRYKCDKDIIPQLICEDLMMIGLIGDAAVRISPCCCRRGSACRACPWPKQVLAAYLQLPTALHGLKPLPSECTSDLHGNVLACVWPVAGRGKAWLGMGRLAASSRPPAAEAGDLASSRPPAVVAADLALC
jgi:hypothetical protein